MWKCIFALLCSVTTAWIYGQTNKTMTPGLWRAELERADGNPIAFNFEFKIKDQKKLIYIRNAAESLKVDDIRFQGDSVWIRLPYFDSEIRAALAARHELRGYWIKHLGNRDQFMPFLARSDQPYRFYSSGGPARHDLTGRWAVLFRNPQKNDSTLCVGEFTQHGNKLTGTFLHPTGDYRYLQGIVSGDSLKLSCFDGSHAYLFTAKIDDNNHISGGQYFSGLTHRELWVAKRDPRAHLPDEFGLTRMKNGASRLSFTFRDIDGNTVSSSDERFKNKVLLVQLMGSWCPNCLDETSFLSKFYESYRKKGVEIIGLAYERSTDFSLSQKNLRSFQERLHVPYPLLITGVSESDPEKAKKTLPQLEGIEGFPTTIFIDRAGQVQKIHTGFNGPATGEHYEEEKKTFYSIVDALLVQ
jgi:peroxiredoxin